jgi:type I restriction enzyme S subunit
MTQLPNGWTWATIGEVCEKPKYGWTTSASDIGEVKLLRTTDLTHGPITWETVPFCKETPKTVAEYEVHPNDIFISRAGSVGVSVLVKDAPYKSVFASYLIRIRPTNKINAKYLSLFLQSPHYWNQVSELSSGIALANINATKIQSMTLPMPPIDEQNKIVELLEDHLSRLDAALADVKQAKVKAAQFRASVLNSIFFDYGSKGWPLYKAADLGKWITGSTPSSKVSDYVGTDVPFITPGDIIDGGKIADYSRMISNSGADSVRRLKSNAVHLVCIGATLGKVGIARFESTSNQQINALEANEEIVLPDFAMWLLASPAMQRELWDASSSTTVPILNKGNLEKIEVRVPAISEQIKALEEFDRARLTLEHLAKDFEIMLEKSNGLRRSILQAAFTGQLTKEVVSV